MKFLKFAILSSAVVMLLSSFWVTNERSPSHLPEGFVYLTDVVPEVILDMRYYGTDNFVGKRVDGYQKPVCIVTKECAEHLKMVVAEVSELSVYVKVFDAYRPQQAVDHFAKWALDLNDTLTRQKYYPEVDKSDLFRLNYIAEKSGHSRGSTIDLTFIDADGVELDMGSSWDYFGTKSWPSDTTVSTDAQKNRNFLRNVMIKHGFKPYNEEWWHFTLVNEPFPDTYFDFVVK